MTPFERQWDRLTPKERTAIAKENLPLDRQDWAALSMDEKRKLYTISFGAPEVVDPYEGRKVALGVALMVSLGLGLFALARSQANPPPRTMTPEYERATAEYLRGQNSNPIFGISSKKSPSIDDLDVAAK